MVTVHRFRRARSPWLIGKRWTVTIFLGVALGAADGPPALVGEVPAFLDDQAAAWTRGDLEGFCSSYLDDVTFVSPSGLARGRSEVLERYRKKYPTKAAMGELTLEVLEARPGPLPVDAPDGGRAPAPVVATVVARWRLDYPGTERATAEGHTLLVLHRTGAGWRIAQDASM
jgi:uncharacterized protein (TIGR02246 family)